MAIESSGKSISSDFVKTKLPQDVHGNSAANGGLSNACYVGKQRYSGGNNKWNGGNNHNEGRYHNRRNGDSNNFGHIARFCPSRKEQKSDDSACVVAARLFRFNAKHSTCDDWYIDSGASELMTGQQEWMSG